MSKLLESTLNAIGNTLILKINKSAPEGISIYIKAEGLNPMESVKDQVAIAYRFCCAANTPA